ncbi:CHAP domain-containing protein [Streptococcus henryi]|uniref:CHAP domain-containing protein n=1 Tax=Streptococcus henryi TaxID=439219 RepID=A0A1G6BNS0_9STRE|nr:phage tail tip lysozyme [Streptococcus henryi]SDB22229.1 CHAP domain-containing protein [Streptococcus henryi]
MSEEEKDFRNRLVRKRHIKESVQRHHQSSARKAQKATKNELKTAKKDHKAAKKAYQKARSDFKDGNIDLEALGDTYDKLTQTKAKQKVAKKIKKKVRKTNPTIGQKARQTGAHLVKRSSLESLELGLEQDDILSDAVQMKHRIHQSQVTARQAGKVIGKGAKLAYRGAKGAVKLGSKGAQKTYKTAKVGTRKAAQATTQITKSLASFANAAGTAVAGLITNPISWIVTAVLGLLLLVVILVSSIFSSNIVQQNEFTLNQSWLHLSKLDRKESSDQVDYYTDIDSILLYMNYRYGGEWEPDAKWDDGFGGKITAALGFNHFSDALDDIWKEENKDIHNLKTMAELYTNGKEWMKFSKDDLEEYKEILEGQTDTGKYVAYQELANPFYPVEDDRADSEYLTITKRYGYTDKDTIDPTTTLQTTTGQKLYAAIDGQATITTKDLKGEETQSTNLIIESDEARFIYYDLSHIRIKTGDTVETGQELASTSDNSLKIAYAKNYGEVDDNDSKWLKEIRDKEVSYGYIQKTKKDKKEVWVLVNPGFYFPFVEYSEKTLVTQTASEMSGRAKQFYDLVKKYLPNATDNGIAAIVGCFGVESSVNPKRAEGDYLSPPIGASDNSWDDETWLTISGPAIYGGGYPNILKRGLGLGQWTDTSDGAIRNTLLRDFAKKKGQKWYTLELQVQFMLEGDNPYYINVFKQIATSQEDVDSLTEAFLANWEGVPGNKLAERQAVAKQALSWFKQPSLAGGGTLASSWNFPEAYRSKVTNPPTQKAMTTQRGSGYEVGQCTWYAYNRLVELGSITDLSGAYGYLGNGQDWVRNLVAKGWKYSITPTKGAVVSVQGGFGMTLLGYGHVAIVEYVNPDGTFLISECNVSGVKDKVHFAVWSPASCYSFATPN